MSDGREVALLDANLFVPTWMIDVLLCFAEAHLYDPVWSERIMDEARAAMMRVRGMSESDAWRATALMDRAFPFASVSGWEELTGGVDLPDPDDRHVVAAARRAGASVIVTLNLKDFPANVIGRYGLRAESPDVFLSRVYDADPVKALTVMRGLVSSKKRPPRTMLEEIEGLERLRLRSFSRRLRDGMRHETD